MHLSTIGTRLYMMLNDKDPGNAISKVDIYQMFMFMFMFDQTYL